jgi:hypothetical protein
MVGPTSLINPLNHLDSYYRFRGCNHLNSNDPASQYQVQKIIQNTVRVQSSLYSMNLGALNVYQRPNNVYKTIIVNGAPVIVAPGVNWNQMSDRKNPHRQPNVIPSRASSTKHTITRCRPGAGSPGGVGVDIKHNSYDRYLARLKGRGPIRRGVIPPNFGSPIPFNRAFPIYGNKIIKTSIVNNCNCPINSKLLEPLLYKTNTIFDVVYEFKLNDSVWALQNSGDKYVHAIITDINNDVYTIRFDDGEIKYTSKNTLLIYFKTSLEKCNIADCEDFDLNEDF